MSLMDNFLVAKYRVVYTKHQYTTERQAGAQIDIHYPVCDDSKMVHGSI